MAIGRVNGGNGYYLKNQMFIGATCYFFAVMSIIGLLGESMVCHVMLIQALFMIEQGRVERASWKGLPYFFQVLNAMFWVGGIYDGIKMENEADIRAAARKDIFEGRLKWANIRRKDESKPRKIVSNLNDYLIESPEFPITVLASKYT